MNIEIIVRAEKDPGFALTKQAAALLQSHAARLWACPEVADTIHARSGMCPVPDLILALGGDGTMMRAAHRAATAGVPILGINLGRVGFLADVERGDLELLHRIFDGNLTVQHRMMLSVFIRRKDGSEEPAHLVLNDAVLSHGTVSRLIETELFCRNNSLGCYRSDGFIASTPTGSTAYSLSAGGPLIDPALEAVSFIPICPFSLTARPIIVPADVRGMIVLRGNTDAYLTIDGEEAGKLSPGDAVIMSKSDLTADFLLLSPESKRSFYDTLRLKMSDSI